MAKKLLLALLLTVVVADEESDMQEMMQMLHETCVEQIGIPEDLITQARTGNFANDNKLKCYMKCLFVETSSMNDDGAFDADATVAVLPSSIKAAASKAIFACKDQTGSDACEIAFNIHKCLYKENPQLYFLI